MLTTPFSLFLLFINQTNTYSYCGYGWVASALLVPLLIQDMASKAGFEASNHAIPCNTTVPGFKCVTPFLGHYLEPGTISLYISSLSSILSFFMSLSISAVADHGCKFFLGEAFFFLFNRYDLCVLT